MLAAYSRSLVRRPYLTNMITMGVTYGLSDVIVQKYFKKQKWKPIPTAKNAFLGGMIIAPFFRLYFSRILPHLAKNVLPRALPIIFKNPTTTKVAFT